jgi:hypothetical protein
MELVWWLFGLLLALRLLAWWLTTPRRHDRQRSGRSVVGVEVMPGSKRGS